MMERRLARRWGRNLMTVVAIAISFTMLIAMTSVAWGIHYSAEEKLKDPPRDLVVSSLGLDPMIEDSHNRSKKMEKDSENFSRVMPLLTIMGRIDVSGIGNGEPMSDVSDMNQTPNEVINIGAVGLIPGKAREFMEEEDQLMIRSDRLEFDSWFTSPGDPFHESGYSSGWTGEVLMDEVIMEEHDLKIGDPIRYVDGSGKITSSFVIRGNVKTSLLGSGLSSDIVGGICVFRLSELQYSSGNHIVKIPGEDGKQHYRRDLSTAIYIDLSEDKLPSESRDEIIFRLREEFPGLEVSTDESRLYRLEEEALILEIFSFSVGISAILVGLLFLSAIMVLDVEERKEELAIMKAIGISRSSIFKQIVSDSFILAGLGALIGMVPGIVGSHFIDVYLRDLYGVDVVFSRTTPALVMVIIFFLCINVLIFSIIPGYSGMMQDHREALGT